MIKAKIAPQSVNSDDAPGFLAPHEVLNVEGMRISVTADGKNYQLENIPSSQLIYTDALWTAPKAVGRTYDLSRNRMLWLHYDANTANQAIYAYDFTANTTYTVLKSSQTAAGLNFAATYRADRNVQVAGDLLLWTDDNNEPQCINIEAGIKLNHPSYATAQPAYVTPIAYENLTLIKRPPAYPLTVAKVTDGAFPAIYIAKNTYQAAYLYEYRDYQRSALSPFASMAWYAYAGDTYNAIDITLPAVEKINDEVRCIHICVRYGNEGKTFIVKTFDKANSADAAAFAAHNAATTLLTYRFYDNAQGIPLSDEEANTPADIVPLKAKTSVVFKNRLGFGNFLTGYDTPVTTSLSATTTSGTGSGAVRFFKSGGAKKLSIQFLDRFRRKCGAVRSSVVVNIPERTYDQTSFVLAINWALSNTNALAEIPDWAYYYQIVMSKDQIKDFFVQILSRQIAYVKKVITEGVATYDYLGVTYSNTDTYALAIDISYLYLFGQGYTYQAGDYAVLHAKGGTNYTLKVLGQDGNYALLSPVDFGNITNSYQNSIPSQTLFRLGEYNIAINLTSSTNPAPGLTVQSSTAGALDVDNARSASNWNINVTDGNEYNIALKGTFKFYPAGSTGSGLFIFDLKVVLTHPTEDNIIITLYHEDGAPQLITANINTTINIPAGYTKAFIYTDFAQDTDGFIYASNITFSTTGISLSLLELYTPYKPAENELFYEMPAVYPVNNPTTSSRTYSALSGTIAGDIALVNRHIAPATDFSVEAMSPNDDTWTSWERDLGWPNEVTDLGQVRLDTTFTWSNTFVNGTKNNGLNKFNPLNRKDIGNTSGSIQKVQLTNKQEEDGTVLLILAQQTALSAYLSEVQLYKSAASEGTITTDEVIGTINELKNSFGTIHPESVVMYNGDVWWYDAVHGLFCQYSDNGVYPVSDFKMNGFFDRYSKKYRSNGYTSYDHPIHTCYDPSSDEVLISLPAVEEGSFPATLPSYTTTPDYTASIQNRFHLYDGRAKTLAYKSLKNQWAGAPYLFIPDCMEYAGNRLLGWNNGALHLFNEDLTTFNTFFGVQYPQRICVPVNVGDASAVKQLLQMALEGNGKVPNYTVLYSSYPVEQITDLVAGDWTNEDGILSASFLRDRLSFTDAVQGLLEGDIITGQNPAVMVEWTTYNSRLIVTFINISLLLSKGTTQYLAK